MQECVCVCMPVPVCACMHAYVIVGGAGCRDEMVIALSGGQPAGWNVRLSMLDFTCRNGLMRIPEVMTLNWRVGSMSSDFYSPL